MSLGFNKLIHSQSTLGTRLVGKQTTRTTFKEGQSIVKNPFKETLPLKFPKHHVVKPCSKTMLDQTNQNPHVSSVRNFIGHNRSRFFEGSPLPLSQTQILSRHPKSLVHSYQPRKLSNSGVFQHLSRESIEYPVRLRTYEDIGTINNSKKMFVRANYNSGPVPQTVQEKKYNSTLDRTWREARRHRDNGIQCQKVIHQAVKVQKREPYYGRSKQQNTSTISYKDLYLKSKAPK